MPFQVGEGTLVHAILMRWHRVVHEILIQRGEQNPKVPLLGKFPVVAPARQDASRAGNANQRRRLINVIVLQEGGEGVLSGFTVGGLATTLKSVCSRPSASINTGGP